jgi:hypothetical protein
MKAHIRIVFAIGNLLAMTGWLSVHADGEKKESVIIMVKTNTSEFPAAQQKMEMQQIESLPTQKKQKRAWEPVTVELHSASRGKPVRVAAKKSSYVVVAMRFLPCEHAVTAFVSDRGNIWVGPEQVCYIETESTIMGATTPALSTILWTDSMIKRHPKEKPDLDTVIRRFDKEVEGKKLRVAAGYFEPDPDTGEELPEIKKANQKRVIDLWSVLSSAFFSVTTFSHREWWQEAVLTESKLKEILSGSI